MGMKLQTAMEGRRAKGLGEHEGTPIRGCGSDEKILNPALAVTLATVGFHEGPR
jgi:hypothetical protein